MRTSQHHLSLGFLLLLLRSPLSPGQENPASVPPEVTFEYREFEEGEEGDNGTRTIYAEGEVGPREEFQLSFVIPAEDMETSAPVVTTGTNGSDLTVAVRHSTGMMMLN